MESLGQVVHVYVHNSECVGLSKVAKRPELYPTCGVHGCVTFWLGNAGKGGSISEVSEV